MNAAVLAAAIAATASGMGASLAYGQAVGPRVLGIDISEWQGNLSQATWNNVKAQGRDFAFIRSSRGGTEGFYNQSDAANNFGRNTQGQRYDDFYFQQNMVRATNAGVLAGPYHFTRPDAVSYVDDYGNFVVHNGYDEAIHFLQMAGMWMKPGYLLPVDDLEAGAAQHSPDSLTNWHVQFANTILAHKGIQPIVYINQNYALNEINQQQPNALVQAMPVNWVARWPNQANPHSIDVHNIDPPASPSTANVYGPYSPTWTAQNQTHPTPQPWKFWQYGSSNTNVAGISPVDVNVAHGDIEFVKDHLVPAMLTTDANANWSTIGNWNSDADPSGLGPAARLPGVNDTVILSRGAANPTITLSSGAHTIRKLFVQENLQITGGSLSVGYVPYAPRAIDFGAGPITAQFSNAVTISGDAAYSAHTTLIDPNITFHVNGGTLTFNTLDLQPHASTPARILMGGDVSIAPMSGAAAGIVSSGGGIAGRIDLGGGNRTLTLADGAVGTDLVVSVPIINGSLTKAGPGAMTLTAANTLAGTVSVNQGAVTLSGAAGTLASAAAFTIHPAGTLTLDNTAGNHNNRIASAPITLDGGTLAFIGAATTETTGNLSVVQGHSTVALSGTGVSTLDFGSFSRSAGATVNFTGAGSSLRATFTSGVTPGAFINQGAFVDGADYAVYNAGTSYVRAMTTGAGANDYAASVAADRHVKLTASAANVASTVIRTLNLAGADVGLTLADGAILGLANGGIIKSGNSASAIAGGGTISLPASADLVINTAGPADELSLLVPITSGTGLTKTGPGVLILAGGVNVYGSNTVVAQGTLRLGAAGAIPDTSHLIVGHGATFDLSGISETIGNLTVHDGAVMSSAGAGTLTLNGASPTVAYSGHTSGGTISVQSISLGTAAGSATFHVPNGASLTDLLVSSILQDGTGQHNLAKTGAGTLALSGANTFTGSVTINGGTLSVNSISATATDAQPLGSSAGAITLSAGGALEYTGAASAALNRPVSVFADGGVIRSTAGLLTLGAGITGIAPAGPGPTLTFDAAGGNISVSGNIGALSVIKDGTGTLTLSAANTYSGNTTLNAGTLAYSAPGNLGLTSNSIVFDGGALRPTAALTEPRNATFLAGGATIDTPVNPTFTGVFSGSGSLAKTGSGILTLTGNHTFTGETHINAGTLNLNGSLHAASAVKVIGGGTLAGSGAVSGPVTLTTGGRVNLSAGATIGSLTVVGPTGGSWTGLGTVTGAAAVPTGTLTIGSGANLTVPAGLNVSGTLAGTGAITGNVILASNELYVATANFGAGANITGNLTVTGVSHGAEWNGQGSVAGTTTVASKTLYVNGNLSGAGGLVLASGTNLKGLGTVSKTITLSGNNRLGGHSRLYKAPGGTEPQLGTLTITTPVNWTGPNLFVSSGIVSTPGDTVSGNLTIDSSATVQHPTNGNLYTQYPGTLGGTGVVSINPTGVLRGPGTVAKQVSLDGGTINFTSAGALGPVGRITSSLGVSSGTWAGIGSVTGPVVVGGPGNFLLGSNANLTAPAGLTVSGGTLSAGNVNSTLTGSLVYASNLPSTFGGRVAGAGNTLTVNNSAALTLTGVSTYTGQTTLNHGALTLTANNQLATSGIVTNMTVVTGGSGGSGHGGTLQLANGVSYSLPLTIGGAGLNGISIIAPGNIGALHALSGINTWSGPITLAGTGSNGTDPLINQVSAASGATLILSSALNQGSGAATLAKSGDGDLVLRGNAPNNYAGLTRLYGGRLIVEKDGALGTTANHTFQLNSASTLAFRAPASSPAGFTYAAEEYLHTDGAGSAGLGQVDNLSGNNTFAGSIAIGGPGNVGSIGVSAGSLTLTGGLYARSGSATRTINKLGAGTLILAGASGTPASSLAIPLTASTLNVSAGAVDLRSPSPAAANAPGLANYTVAAGATLLNAAGTLEDVSLTVNGAYRQSAARLHNASLAVNSGGIATLLPSASDPSTLSSLILSGTGILDLTSNELILNQTGPAPVQAVRQYLFDSRLISTTPDPGDLLSLAYLDDGSAIRIHLTYTGDANGDGRIDPDDFALTDAGFATGAGVWWRGDFNYDGTVNQLDYLLIDRTFALQGPPLSPSFLAIREAQFGPDYVQQLLVSIPEPSLTACIVGLCSLLARRRRR